jgi:hypothetical protein
MCKKLVSLELYDNAKKAFEIFENLKSSTSLSWSMFKGCADANGRTLYEIYGLFEDEEINIAMSAINNENMEMII